MPVAEANPKTGESKQEALLRRVREDYRYCKDYWREIFQEAETDSQYMAGDVFTATDIAERENRPSLVPDELSQYTKQANNNLRQNKRAIKVNPKGNGATDEDAERRAAIIKGIEYQSNAQAAYTTAFEACVETSMGHWRITTEEINANGDVQPRIKRIANQFTVYRDPMAREADFSDSSITFVQDVLRKRDFERKYPNAQNKSMGADEFNSAADWVDGDNIVVAEYWVREDGKVKQYITNGFEILEEHDWPGSWIPIVSVFGEEKYIRTGGKSKRMFFSLIRRARVPQKMLAFIASQEAEEFGMSPRAPLLGYKGQFDSQREAWEVLNKVARAYMEFDIPSDWQPNWGPPPAPQRPQFIPNIAAYEAAFERWRRSIQAAMGITPLPTAAQRQNEKSGVALERIQTQQAIGSFHFTDNFDRALENCGRQLNELITLVMDTPRDVGIRNPDESHEILKVGAQKHLDSLPQQLEGDPEYLVTDRGEFDVTISTGPSNQSQREEASSFIDLLVQNLQLLTAVLPQQITAQILGLGIKLKNLGPIGEEIAQLIMPPQQDEIPPQAQAALAQAQQVIQNLQGQLQQLSMEKQAKVVEKEYEMKVQQLRSDTELAKANIDREIKLAIAEIETKAQIASERAEFVDDAWKQLHSQAHDVAMQAQQQSHDQDMADKQAVIASAQSAQDAEQNAAAQENQNESES